MLVLTGPRSSAFRKVEEVPIPEKVCGVLFLPKGLPEVEVFFHCRLPAVEGTFLAAYCLRLVFFKAKELVSRHRE